MPYLVDTDVLVDVSRNSQGAIACLDSLGNGWALSAMTALELISGAKNQREVDLIDRLIDVYNTSRSMKPSEDALTNCLRPKPNRMA